MPCATAGSAEAADCAVLTDRRGVWEKRQTVSPYRLPAKVALKSAKISPDFASSIALDLWPAIQLHQSNFGSLKRFDKSSKLHLKQ